MNANTGMEQIIFLLTTLIFLAENTPASSNSELAELQKLITKLNKNYKEHGLDGIHKDLKNAWAKVMKAGEKHSSSEMSNLQEFLKQLEEDYNKDVNEVQNDPEDEWEKYIKVFGKNYTPEEKEMRKGIFRKNKEHTEKHNKMFKRGKVSYSIKLNHLSDRTWEELQQTKGFRLPNSTYHATPHARSKRALRYFNCSPPTTLPPLVDWREKGFVTPVKNQGNCGGCYAFVGIGALEAYHWKITGNLISLSEQNIIDCTWNIGNDGCRGGEPSTVFDYARCRGVLSEEQYPYTMNASYNCKWKKEHVAATDKGYLYVPHGNERALQYAVASRGPVAASIYVARDFGNYKEGVYNPTNSYPRNIFHAVLIVGYGSHPSWGDYWICKNSYGKSWGINGYGWMARNKNNVCDVATYAIFPI